MSPCRHACQTFHLQVWHDQWHLSIKTPVQLHTITHNCKAVQKLHIPSRPNVTFASCFDMLNHKPTILSFSYIKTEKCSPFVTLVFKFHSDMQGQSDKKLLQYSDNSAQFSLSFYCTIYKTRLKKEISFIYRQYLSSLN